MNTTRTIRIGLLILAVLLSACSARATPEPDATSAPYAPTLFQVRAEAKAGQARLDDPRPNIIFILTDDQPYDTVQFMPTVRDVLLKKGVNFENGFITTPLCCPSRSSILTGQYVHNHQVYTNSAPLGGASRFDDRSTIATWMQSAGYRTAYYGKYLNDYDGLSPVGYVPPGWDDWAAFLGRNLTDDDIGSDSFYKNYSVSENGKVVEYTQETAPFSADLITQKSVDFIAANRDMPFFLYIGYYNPHSPYSWAERHHEQFRANSALPAPAPYRPPNFLEEDMSDKPQYLQAFSKIASEDVDVAYKQIMRSLLSVDDGVASILNALEQTGLSGNTVIVFMTDNSVALGNHGLALSKNCPYEECIRTPFIVYAPDLFPARTDSRLVANIDIAPTFADLAGGNIPPTVDGMSLVPLLENPNSGGRDAILVEHWPTEEGMGSRIPEFHAVRTSEWKYVEYSTGEKELYDLVNDPYELINVANDLRYEALMAGLKARLDELKAE